jgi:hypothetical protein
MDEPSNGRLDILSREKKRIRDSSNKNHFGSYYLSWLKRCFIILFGITRIFTTFAPIGVGLCFGSHFSNNTTDKQSGACLTIII